jgi:hypothetical protein
MKGMGNHPCPRIDLGHRRVLALRQTADQGRLDDPVLIADISSVGQKRP